MKTRKIKMHNKGVSFNTPSKQIRLLLFLLIVLLITKNVHFVVHLLSLESLAFIKIISNPGDGFNSDEAEKNE